MQPGFFVFIFSHKAKNHLALKPVSISSISALNALSTST